MGKASPLQSSFLGGEISPFCVGRVDIERFKASMAEILNYLPMLQGGLARRPGSRAVSEAKYIDKKCILQKFIYSTQQAYQIEVGHLYMRFYKDDDQILRDEAIAITGASKANPCVITAPAHGIANGAEIFISGVVGMTELNGRNFVVQDVTTNTFTLRNHDGSPTGLGLYTGTNVNSTGYTTYVSGGTTARVYELVTPYTEDEVEELGFSQSADVLFITHVAHKPAQLIRHTHSDWTLVQTVFRDGPFDVNVTTGVTLTPSNGTSLTPTITASAASFVLTDVGRMIRVQVGGTWKWMMITAFTNSTTVTVLRDDTSGIGTTAIATWRFGIWSDTTGYPAVTAFHEGRIVYAGTPIAPQRFDMSVSNDFVTFSETHPDATVTDELAVSRTLNSEDVNSILWMKSGERALLVGTAASEWAVRPSVLSDPISPSNINAKQVSNHGSAKIQAVVAGTSTFFVQASTRVVREMAYDFRLDTFRSPDRTILADHISGAQGFKQMARQREKPSLIWATRSDGTLAGMTYELEDDALIVAWHRHQLGGVSDAAGAPALVNWCSVTPSVDGKRDQLWMVTTRYLNGVQKKCIEFLWKIFEPGDDARDAFHVDYGITFDDPKNIVAATVSTPIDIGVTAHGFSDGDKVTITGVGGMTELNGKTYLVRFPTADNFTLETLAGVLVSSADFTPWAGGGVVRKHVTRISGLWYLEGETIDFWADAALQPPQKVVNGTVTLQNSAATIQIGFPVVSRGKMLRLEAGAADGTAVGKTRRVNRINFVFDRTLGFKHGTSYDALSEIKFRKNTDPDGQAIPLFTGVKSENTPANYDYDNQICWEQSRPSPGHIIAVAPQLHTEDRG